MGVEYKDVIRLETTAALMPTTVKSGQLGFATDDNKMGRLWLDGITMTWHTPDGGHPWFTNCDLGEYLNHYQDTDTFLRFQTDRITLEAGGVEFLDCNESTADLMTLGNGTMKIDVDNFKVGIGTVITTPDYDFEVRNPDTDYTTSSFIVDYVTNSVFIGGLSTAEVLPTRFLVRNIDGSQIFDVNGGTTTNPFDMVIASQGVSRVVIGAPIVQSYDSKLHLYNALGETPDDFLLIEGDTADNNNYPGISFKGGTLANVYPNLQLENGGLGFEINSGSHSSSYTKSIHASLTAAATEAGASFKVYNQDSDLIIHAQGDGNIGFSNSGLQPWHSSFVALQLGGDSAIMSSKAESGGTNGTSIMDNMYYDGAWKPVASGQSTLMTLRGGGFYFNGNTGLTADVGFSPTTLVTILPTGLMGLGMTPTYQLQLSTDSAAKPSTNTWTVPSDKRMKKNIKPFSKYGLKELLSLKPVEFKYNGKYGSIDDDKKQVGYLAQQVKEVMPEMVSSIEIDGEEILNVNSHLISFAVIEAIKELNDKIEALKK